MRVNLSSESDDRTKSDDIISQSIESYVATQYPGSPPSRLRRIATVAKLAFKGYAGSKRAISGEPTNEEEMKKLVEHWRDIHMEIEAKTIIYVDEGWVDSKFGVWEINGFSGSAFGFGAGASYFKIFSGEERFWAVNKKCGTFAKTSALASHLGMSLRFEGAAEKNGGPTEAEGKKWNSFKLVLGSQVLYACYQDENLKAGWSIEDVIKLGKVFVVSEVSPSQKLFVRAIYVEKGLLQIAQAT